MPLQSKNRLWRLLLLFLLSSSLVFSYFFFTFLCSPLFSPSLFFLLSSPFSLLFSPFSLLASLFSLLSSGFSLTSSLFSSRCHLVPFHATGCYFRWHGVPLHVSPRLSCHFMLIATPSGVRSSTEWPYAISKLPLRRPP